MAASFKDILLMLPMKIELANGNRPTSGGQFSFAEAPTLESGAMKKSSKFSPEVRERAVRMVLEHRAEQPSQWAAIESNAGMIGCVPQTLHTWAKQH